MKDYYTISEISKLYGIGTDSLRYYEEIGALEPKRGKNNYRLYRLKDICRLNTIRDLLQLGFSMKQVKAYLDDMNLENTLCMLEDPGAAGTAEACGKIHRKKNGAHSEIQGNGRKFLSSDMLSRQILSAAG